MNTIKAYASTLLRSQQLNSLLFSIDNVFHYVISKTWIYAIMAYRRGIDALSWLFFVKDSPRYSQAANDLARSAYWGLIMVVIVYNLIAANSDAITVWVDSLGS